MSCFVQKWFFLLCLSAADTDQCSLNPQVNVFTPCGHESVPSEILSMVWEHKCVKVSDNIYGQSLSM